MFGLEIVLLGVIIWAIVTAAKRRGETQPDVGGVASARRLFQYVMAYAAFVVASIGFSNLLGSLISDAAARSEAELAVPLAMTIVGVPVYVALARWVWRTHAADPAERNGVGWALYVNAALITALTAGIGAYLGVARGVIDGDWEGGATAALVVWTAGWIAHWQAWRRVRPGQLTHLHLWIGSLVGLGVAAGSAGFVLAALGERALGALTTGVAATLSGDDLSMAAAAFVIGGAVWTWHWLMNGLTAERSEGWYITVLLFGVLGGLVTAVTGAGHGLYLLLEWFLGEPGTTSAVSHFQQLSTALATAVVGLAVWRYHRAVIGPSISRQRTEIDRAYDYIVSGVGLTTVAISLVVLIVALFEVVTPAAAAGDGDTDVLLVAVTLLVVGLPVWLTAWRRVQRIASTDPEAEIPSAARRTYLFAIFGVGGAIAFGALIALLVAIFEVILEDASDRGLAESVDIPAALLITTGLAAVYHWTVYRAERHVSTVGPRRDVLLVSAAPTIGAAVAEMAHVRVRTLHRLDVAEGIESDVEAIVAAIDRAEGEHLLVLAGVDEIQVVPFE